MPNWRETLEGLRDGSIPPPAPEQSGATVPDFSAAPTGAALKVVQTLPVNAQFVFGILPGATVTGGTYTLTFRGDTTVPIAFDAGYPTITAALEALASIGSGNVVVFNSSVMPDGVVTGAFQGVLAGQALSSVMTINGTGLTGPDAPYTFSDTGSHDGHPGGPKHLAWVD
jgi:hypothetical protein